MRMRDIINLIAVPETAQAGVVAGLGKTEAQVVEDFQGGLCYALALAHHRRFGWPCWLVATTEDDPDDLRSFHAFVRHPSGAGLDIDGPQDPSTILMTYGGEEDDGWRLVPVSEAELLAHLSPETRKFEIGALPYAASTIERYLKPRFPDLY